MRCWACQYDLGNNWPLRHAAGNSLQIVPALAASSGETLAPAGVA